MNIFLFHRDLRIIDNTTLIKQIQAVGSSIVPIFIFPPQQINPKKNSYFSNNSVQFMIQSLKQLNESIEKYDGKLLCFEGDNIDVLKDLHKIKKIKSIGFNIDYTPYARKRDDLIQDWATKQKIKIFHEQDYLLHNILLQQTVSPKSGNPYLVFTPFRNFCQKQLKVPKPSYFNYFKFDKLQDLQQKSQFSIPLEKCEKFYTENKEISINGGRSVALKILQNIKKFKNYNKDRNYPIKPTTFLSAHLHFTTVSIRQVYHQILNQLGMENNLINQLYWRDFYVNITYYHPRVLTSNQKQGKSFQSKFDNVKWKYNQEHLKLWKQGKTGFPIVDAAMRQMNTTGYMHNRCRMIVANFFSKDLFLDWRQGQKYFATKLTDYSPMQNSGGWQWAVGNGTDSQPYFRIFNPWTQQKNYDENCVYIKKWIPQLKDIPNNEIHTWYISHQKYLKKGIKYYSPIVQHDTVRKQTLDIYKKQFAK